MLPELAYRQSGGEIFPVEFSSSQITPSYVKLTKSASAHGKLYKPREIILIELNKDFCVLSKNNLVSIIWDSWVIILDIVLKIKLYNHEIKYLILIDTP